MTKKMNKRLCAAGRCMLVLVLSISLVFAASIVPVNAVEKNTVIISSVEEFAAFASECYIDSWSTDKVIELKADLDFTGREITIIPVFDGTFHGNGHTISGLDYEGDGYVTALFRYVEQNGVIDSLNVSGNISATDEKECVGGIVGINYGTIRNCSFSGRVNGSVTIGGIAAFNKSTGIIRKCTVSGSITGSYYTGGITGKNHGIITNCKNTAGVNSDSEWVEAEDEINTDILGSLSNTVDNSSVHIGVDTGGIAGYSDGIIASCSNLGQIGYEHVGYNIGGIVGRQSGVVSQSINSGRIYGRKDVGGIVGQMEPYIEIIEAETIKSAVNELHDLLDKTITDMDDGGDIIHADLDELRTHADNLVDTGHMMADNLYDFADSNMDQLDAIVERFEYVVEELCDVFDNLSASTASMNAAVDNLDKLNDDLDIKGMIDANSGEKAEYDAAKAQIENAIDVFNDAANNDSRKEIESIIKDENGEYRSWADLTEAEQEMVIDGIADILENSEKMLQACGDILDGLNRINNVVTPYIDYSMTAVRNDIDNAVANMHDSLEYMNKAVDGLKGIVNYLNAQSDIRFSRLPDEYYSHRDNLYQELKEVSDCLERLGNNTEGFSDTVNADMKAVNDKLNEIFNLVIDKLEAYMNLDTEGVYDDISDEEIDNTTSGVVEGCTNNSDVSADINVGGIAGSMAIDNDDLESNAAGSADITLGSRYLAKCIINNCRNDGYITSKKDGAGGVAGYMKLGVIRDSKSYGSVESTDGGYAGGICGQSFSIIKSCYSLCSVFANKYVGGIAGYGDVIKDCYAMVYLESESGRVGAIAGQTSAYEDEEVENEGNVAGNFYVNNGIHGIDGISYVGVAQPIEYNELLMMRGIPNDFRHLKVSFRIDNIFLGSEELEYGELLSNVTFPSVPERQGYYAVWPDLNDRIMIGNIVINGEYVQNVIAVGGNGADENGRAYALAADNFTGDTVLNVSLGSAEPPEQAEGGQYVIYDISLENISKSTGQNPAIRLLNPYEDDVEVYYLDNSEWKKAEHKIRGSYVQVSLQGTEGTFCVVEKKADYRVIIMAAGAAVMIAMVVLIISGIKKTKRGKRGKKDN